MAFPAAASINGPDGERTSESAPDSEEGSVLNNRSEQRRPTTCRRRKRERSEREDAMIDFKAETEVLADETRIVSIAGELDMYTAPRFERQILDAIENGSARVVVDLSECSLLDSTALGILISANRRLGKQKHRLVLVAADRNILTSFQITGLNRAFTIVPTQAWALNGATDWRDEEARTRGVFREVNEQIKNLYERYGLADSEQSFICECGNSTCTKALTLPIADYEAVRGHARRFLIALDHENPEIERLVHENGHFAVVETFVGDASRIPEETDPRDLTLSH